MNMIKKLSLALILAGLCLPTGTAHAADNKQELAKQALIHIAKSVGKTVFTYLACLPITVIAHEYGHWVVARFFGHSEATIHISAPTNPDTSTPFKLGHLHIHSWNPVHLLTRDNSYCSHQEENNTIKRVAICLAGPVAGAAATCVLTALLSKYCFTNESPENKKELLNVFLISGLLGQASQLVPYEGSDGWQIKQAITDYLNNA